MQWNSSHPPLLPLCCTEWMQKAAFKGSYLLNGKWNQKQTHPLNLINGCFALGSISGNQALEITASVLGQ